MSHHAQIFLQKRRGSETSPAAGRKDDCLRFRQLQARRLGYSNCNQLTNALLLHDTTESVPYYEAQQLEMISAFDLYPLAQSVRATC